MTIKASEIRSYVAPALNEWDDDQNALEVYWQLPVYIEMSTVIPAVSQHASVHYLGGGKADIADSFGPGGETTDAHFYRVQVKVFRPASAYSTYAQVMRHIESLVQAMTWSNYDNNRPDKIAEIFSQLSSVDQG